METIVVGIDGSEPAVAALQWAVKEAMLRQCTLRVVHAWQPVIIEGYPYTSTVQDPRAQERIAHEILARAIDVVVERYGGEVLIERLAVCGAPASVLIDSSRDADLLVVGSRGRGGFAGLVLGSVSQQVAHHAHCPVVIVR